MSDQFSDTNPSRPAASADTSPGIEVPRMPRTEIRKQSERNKAAVQLLKAWLRADASIESDTWDLLQSQLDRDRLSGRVLFL